MRPGHGDGREYWDRHASRYDRSVALFRRPLATMLQRLQAELTGCHRVLEVAAGTGIATVVAARVAREVLATDYSAEMVEQLTRRIGREGLANVTCERRDLYDLRLPPAFDAVVCANALHLVADLEGALAALTSVVRPGGKVIVPTFAHDETLLSRAVSRLLAVTGFPGARRFTLATLQSAVSRAGLLVSSAETLPGILPIAFVSARAAGNGPAVAPPP